MSKPTARLFTSGMAPASFWRRFTCSSRANCSVSARYFHTTMCVSILMSARLTMYLFREFNVTTSQAFPDREKVFEVKADFKTERQVTSLVQSEFRLGRRMRLTFTADSL